MRVLLFLCFGFWISTQCNAQIASLKIDTHMAQMWVNWYSVPGSTKYGGLTYDGSNLYYMNRLGALSKFDPMDKSFKQVATPALPIGNDDFEAFTKAHYPEKYKGVRIFFGVKDIAFSNANNKKTLYVLSLEFQKNESCVGAAVFSLNMDAMSEGWKKIGLHPVPKTPS